MVLGVTVRRNTGEDSPSLSTLDRTGELGLRIFFRKELITLLYCVYVGLKNHKLSSL
jgi:hypothetical protein